MFFQRDIRVTSSGPLFLSVEIHEGAGCGGVHPYNASFTLTYDLTTGALVKWSKYLTRTRAKDLTFTPLTEGMILPAVRSAVLEKLFVAGWQDRQGCTVEAVVGPDSKSEAELTDFQLSAATGGLSVLPVNLASAASACAAPVILGKSGMDELGIPQNIQDALLHQ
ncbi:hypothetical protein [Terriglobus roseus]|nr:hypothetical protein [Terriglobus roseus]